MKFPFACDKTNLYSNFLQVQNIMIIIVGYYFCTAYYLPAFKCVIKISLISINKFTVLSLVPQWNEFQK